MGYEVNDTFDELSLNDEQKKLLKQIRKQMNDPNAFGLALLFWMFGGLMGEDFMKESFERFKNSCASCKHREECCKEDNDIMRPKCEKYELITSLEEKTYRNQ